ncbi:hypothetical protein ACFTXM_41615 [Streptomyces sp. NPDC056930]|uniref:hypothetical protein n=1 Tax=Streptomyces sp. NPDC056930 TaxID=3345967 RepID=UPI00363C7CD6
MDTDQGEYLGTAECERLGLPDPPGRPAAFAVSVAALVVFCTVLVQGTAPAGLGRAPDEVTDARPVGVVVLSCCSG